MQHLDVQLSGAESLGHVHQLDQRHGGQRLRRGGNRRCRGGTRPHGRPPPFPALGTSALPVCARAAAAGALVPITTVSPGSRPDRICADTRFITPTFTSRSVTSPLASTTLTSARPPAYRLRGSVPAEACAARFSARPFSAPPFLSAASPCLAPRDPRRVPSPRPVGRSAESGTSTASLALATTKKTCAVICVIRV